MGGFIVTPFLLQNVLGYGPAHSGLLSIARPLAFSIAGPIAGYITVRVGERTNAVLGAAVHRGVDAGAGHRRGRAPPTW